MILSTDIQLAKQLPRTINLTPTTDRFRLVERRKQRSISYDQELTKFKDNKYVMRIPQGPQSKLPNVSKHSCDGVDFHVSKLHFGSLNRKILITGFPPTACRNARFDKGVIRKIEEGTFVQKAKASGIKRKGSAYRGSKPQRGLGASLCQVKFS